MQLGKYDGELKVDCNTKRCRLTGADGFEITILDDLTPCMKEGKAVVHTQFANAIGDKPTATRLTILLT